MSNGPQDPPPQEPQFPAYPGAPDSGRYAVLMINERAGQQNLGFPTQATDEMSEAEALNFLESVARRQQPAWVEITDKDMVLQLSPRELVIYRSGFWMGDRMTRVVVGQVR